MRLLRQAFGLVLTAWVLLACQVVSRTPTPAPAPTLVPARTQPVEPTGEPTAYSLPTDMPPVLPNLTPTAVPSRIATDVCAGPSEVGLGQMSLAFVAAWDGDNDVYVIGGDGVGRRVFIQTEADEFGAAWSPDGKRLAYLAGQFDPIGPIDLRLFLSPAEGEVGIALAPELRVARPDLVWSPDGQWIAFPAEAVALGIVEISTRRAHTFSWIFGPELISWSADSERLIFAAVIAPRTVYYQLVGVDRDGEDIYEYSLDLGSIKSIAWHPYEERILYTSTLESIGTEVYVMDLDGSDVQRLTTTGGFDGLDKGDAEWSPDGARTAYKTVNWFQPDPAVDVRVPHHTLHVMNADGSGDLEIVAAPDDVGHAVNEFEWAPDGRHIAYASTRFSGKERGPSDLHVVDVCTGEDLLIAQDVLTYMLSWKPLP